MRSCTGVPSDVLPGPDTPVRAARRAARRPRRSFTSAAAGSTITTPSAPSTITLVPVARARTPTQPTTAGSPSDLEMIAVWLVGPPCSVTIARTCVGAGAPPHPRRGGQRAGGGPPRRRARGVGVVGGGGDRLSSRPGLSRGVAGGGQIVRHDVWRRQPLDRPGGDPRADADPCQLRGL